MSNITDALNFFFFTDYGKVTGVRRLLQLALMIRTSILLIESDCSSSPTYSNSPRQPKKLYFPTQNSF